MYKDKVVITVVALIVVSAIIFGAIMAYNSYKSPMIVDDIDRTIFIINGTSDNDQNHILERFYMLKKLSISCKMKNQRTGETRRFSKEEINALYEKIGGKEAVLNYLRNIQAQDEKRHKLIYSREQLKIITDDEFSELWQ